MTEWVPGMPCRVVEHDDATRKPKPGGRVEATTVDRAVGAYVSVRTARWGLMSFWAETGWSSWTGDFRWRLLPGTGEEAATGGGATRGNDMTPAIRGASLNRGASFSNGPGTLWVIRDIPRQPHWLAYCEGERPE